MPQGTTEPPQYSHITSDNYIFIFSVRAPADGMAQGGWKRWGPAGRGYSPATVEAVAGEAVRVERQRFGKGQVSGVGLTLKTGKEPVRVFLGPVNLLTAGNGPPPG